MALSSRSLLVRRVFGLTASVEAPILVSTPRQQKQQQQQQRQFLARAFHTSSPTFKKRKAAPASNSPPRNSNNTSSSPGPAAEKSAPNPEDPLDFSSLHAVFAATDAHFKAQLQTVLHGGRFNPDNLGALPVSVKPSEEANGAHKTTTTFPLRELAQVVPRSGRTISLLVNDREYIKPIMSAVQASKDYNQQPQRSEDNDLELLMKVELERKDDLIRRVKEVTQGWKEKIRQGRSRFDKTLKGWAKKGTVLKDVAHKAEKELQKVLDEKMKEIAAEEAQALKQLER
ncbi:hypothetical protein E4U17_007198 [Claviceps sp. LM77 group G4]|nr:hypothetical protein E4U17_007198 [Claviceps sp. LM77 group G4]KAG6069597.1 hypothetical protein E4U33_004723 [Claviceps sp. LM78 group G4]KAG6082593.1 hypothetical protein E4U16_005830 [Claviceps sp. LM84 group G4]